MRVSCWEAWERNKKKVLKKFSESIFVYSLSASSENERPQEEVDSDDEQNDYLK